MSAAARKLEHLGRVLVVDDYADARANLRDLVEGLGIPVVEAADGQEAFNLLIEQRTPDIRLILLDLDMPRMTGWELLKLLKSYFRFATIPVVVVSKHAAYLRATDLQVLDGWLEAPADPGELRELIEALVLH